MLITCIVGVLFTLGNQTKAQKVGLLLDSYVTDRWNLDQKFFSDHITVLGGECVVAVAYGDPDEQLRLAKKMITEGVDVLAVVPTDALRASEIVEVARRANVPVISYDRLILSPDISVYISYNNVKVGQLQAEYVISKIPAGKYFLMNGPVSDNNAVMLREGQLKILEPHLRKGKIRILEDFVMKNWSEIGAFEKMKEVMAADGEMPDVILAANDAVANGAIQALPGALAGKIIVSGQDADLTAIRNIIAGTQAMTVYKPIKPLAQLAAQLSMDLANGKKPIGTSRVSSGGITVDAILLDPLVVDKSNYKETVIRDGHASLSEVLRNLSEVFEQERSKIQLSLLQKEKALETEQKENQRKIFSVIVFFFILSIAGLAFTIYHKQKDNKQLNNQKRIIENKNEELHRTNAQLVSLNEELLQKQEEISSQRDAISHQKEKLEEVNQIIEKQKDEILHQNETLEAEVERRTADLIQYNKQLEQYAFVTAHNLRAPVARIIGLCQLINMDHSDAVETRSIIGRLLNSSEELDQVIKELNAILNIRTFSMEMLTRVDLDEEFDRVTQSLASEIETTRARVKKDFRAVRSITSIKAYIHSIIFNLISNAIKYRHPERDPVIMVKTEKLSDGVCLSVTDNGIGIDLTSHQEMVFQLYKRFHFHVEGRGIGLFLVKTQIDSLGGSIEIESEVNKGTKFKIILLDRAGKNNHPAAALARDNASA